MAEVTVRAGRKSEIVSPERRQRLAELADVLRFDGYDVEVEIIEYEPGRRGVAFPEFVYVYIAGPAAGALAVKVINDVYDKAKAWARRQWAAKQPPEPVETHRGRPEVVLLYGPDGEIMRRWRIDEGGECDEPVE